MNSSDITSAMDFNCKLMEVQIQLVEQLTALQVGSLSSILCHCRAGHADAAVVCLSIIGHFHC